MQLLENFMNNKITLDMKNEVEILRISYLSGIIVENSPLFEKLCLMVTCL